MLHASENARPLARLAWQPNRPVSPARPGRPLGLAAHPLARLVWPAVWNWQPNRPVSQPEPAPG
ncbi:hypothetical protein [Diaminobutyricibacter sp. McL0608]|uniref:hypothetical protein n=1 Tax=Leifsonia sp. McL0608 TaxID=3143537 RepID=UPI0031F327F6